ncbi:MAG: flippase-like domain-containing protein [Pseudonocardia sp.]|nr:flippase-like domain-containing protein [Pseudonocardia sp.]
MSLTGFAQPTHINAGDAGGVATAILEHPAVPAPRGGAHGRTSIGGSRRRGRQIAAGVVVALVLGTEAVLAAPYLGTAMAAVTGAAGGWVGLAMLASAGSLTAFALLRRALLRAAGVDVSTGSTLASVLVANAFHMTLPGGVAFSTGYAYRWMQRHGAGPTVAGWSLVVSGLLSTVGLATLGLSASLLVGSTSWTRMAVEIIGIAVLVLGVGRLVRDPNRVLAAAERALAVVNRLRRRPPAAGSDRLVRIAEQLPGVRPSARDWTAATGHALLNWLLDLACLAACAHAVGLTGVGTTALLATYVAGMAASGLSLLPGGLGTVDAALILGLVAAGSPATVALSAVVLYRMISLVAVVAAGWAVHAVYRRR